MKTLLEIYNTPLRPYRMHRWDHYIPIYERHFSTLRLRRPVRMLEIGVQYGGGLWMWSQYFQPASAIFGVDVNPGCIRPDLPDVMVYFGDQADPAFWQRILPRLGKLDIIIDDGGHTMNQQITAFECLYQTMADDGIYLVEDTHTSHWGGTFHDRPDGLTFLEKARQDTARLLEWSGNPRLFNVLMSEHRGETAELVSEFCRTTQAIHFYDSIVVYERGRREAPRHGLR